MKYIFNTLWAVKQKKQHAKHNCCIMFYVYIIHTPETLLWYVTLNCIVGKSLAHIFFVHTMAEKRDTKPNIESF